MRLAMSSDLVKAPTDLWGELRGQKARIEALEAENAQLREALRSVETQADNAAWNIGRPGHNFTPADIQAGYFNIRDVARRAREGGNADG